MSLTADEREQRHIDGVRTALALSDAGYIFQPRYADVAVLLQAYDRLVRQGRVNQSLRGAPGGGAPFS